jgi:hypothetical protein
VPDRAVRPVVLRNGVEIDDPLGVVLHLAGAFRPPAAGDMAGSAAAAFREADLRLANRNGARISALQIGVILERRRAIEKALRAIAPDSSLMMRAAADEVPWAPMKALFDAFAEVKGVGFSKMTKALHPKRPALIPMLDSVVQSYLDGDDPGGEAGFGERAIALTRGYKRDLDANRVAMRRLRRELAKHGHAFTEVRILDLLIWSVAGVGGRSA